MTASVSSSDDSYKITVSIDQEKIKRQNLAHPPHQCYHLHELMSSTNETQDKEYNGLRFPNFSPKKQHIASAKSKEPEIIK